jgi:hypothetical protein
MIALANVHHHGRSSQEITVIEGMHVDSIARTIVDLLHSGWRLVLIRQAIIDARREG